MGEGKRHCFAKDPLPVLAALWRLDSLEASQGDA